jgi:predicted AlkP superfamily pyrophosphatase or phosphodiesterase
LSIGNSKVTIMTGQTSLHLKIGVLATALLLAPGWIAAGAVQPPRLILQITVDALRGDLPGRYAHLFGDGGFRYLMDEGVHYTNAHYQHANTETIVGHVSLATGTVPAAHGMVGNVWFDRADGRLVYNIEDPDHCRDP